jgi:type III restriction enzyme
MKLKFNAELTYQKDAIAAAVDLFRDMPNAKGAYTDLGIANAWSFYETAQQSGKLLENLHAVQERHFIEKSSQLLMPDDIYSFPNYSIEMETGTGKTYVYLRSIFELNKIYGLRKFIIVVPSVAIREGVLASIESMREHFGLLYNNLPFDHYVYRSADLSKVRQFATSNTLQIMIINVQAFQKDAGDIDDYTQLTDEQRKKLNVIHQDQDRMSGRRPIEFIQTTRPVLIIDEPQSVDNTPKAKRAIKSLNPLFALRYSATHKNPYNQIYELRPIQAYDAKLVKQISVSSIESERDGNQTFLRLDWVGYEGKSKTPSAKIALYEDTPKGPKEKIVKLKQGTDLADQTNRSGYQGYVVDEIYAESGVEYVRFANNKVFDLKQEQGGLSEDVMKLQIRLTIEEHLKKERNLQKTGKAVKVLSLFFIDKVKNYRDYDENGNPQKGKLALWFEEAYLQLAARPEFSKLPKRDVETVHDGYFSTDKKRGKIVSFKDTTGTTSADDETYALIMKDKERLLSEETPLRFIFSHSALKEGWDNPNVFQICSLREFGSEQERRQTLGRGLRLAVDANGERIYDPVINRLTVVASESFESYARNLQTEIEKDVGGDFKFGRVKPIAFAALLNEQDQPLGQEQSQTLWLALQANGYLNELGDLTQQFTPDVPGFKLELPEPFSSIALTITDKLKSFLFAGRVQDNRKRQAVRYNKDVELNEDFKQLWEKIKYKTRYRINFDTQDLIKSALERIKEMPEIKPVTLTSSLTMAAITEAGVVAERELQTPKSNYVVSHNHLPDILEYLQRETELTRGTLVDILKGCNKLQQFKYNPQAFMTAVAQQILKARNKLLVDDIKYEKLDGSQAYAMTQFEHPEVEAYLHNLYKIQHSKNESGGAYRTTDDYISYQSELEHQTAKLLDESKNVLFFCKLPYWFKIDTPVGTYNPDWAIVLQDDEKLYLVRETKSSLDNFNRRELENLKIICGKSHFKALNVDYAEVDLARNIVVPNFGV